MVALRWGLIVLVFRILGRFEVVDGDRPLVLGGPKLRSLLAMLLLHRGEVVSRLVARQARTDIKAGPHASDRKRGQALAQCLRPPTTPPSPKRSPRCPALGLQNDRS